MCAEKSFGLPKIFRFVRDCLVYVMYAWIVREAYVKDA